MIVTILAPSEQALQALDRAVRQALRDLTLVASIEHVTDPRAIARHGVRNPPAVMVDGRLVLSGRVAGAAELQALLAVAPAS